MSSPIDLSFKGRVVVITGAGGGLGRIYALEYARRGAKVVVNDLGGNLAGSGNSGRAADLVVEEIKAKGGIAIANYDSVTDGEKVIKTAIDAFGRVDVIVNNAGILRDSTLARMDPKDFELVVAVHLTGAYKLSKAAWPYMREQKFGRILNTASPAGLYGNFGQTNYSAAKCGQIGLAETLAKEGDKYNIKVNVIAPLARSRMTEGLMPDHVLKAIAPEKVLPLVLYLTHEDTAVTNSIFEAAAGFYTQVRWQRSGGELFNLEESSFTPEAILNKFPAVVDFKDKPFKAVDYPTGVADYNALIEKARQLPPDPQGATKLSSLKKKVVIVTGAGGGLGKSHALWFAKYGAKVLVNDIGDPDAAVEEINKLYGAGTAAPDRHNVVTEAKEIVENAIKTFGRVDVLVNNAGILRDRSFLKMTDEEWDIVLKVHLLSTAILSKTVWPIFVKQKSGIIINTSSTSGIYGSFGQANYAAAKSAIIGFSRSLALEGHKHGIKVVSIAPHAETAMTKTIFGEKELKNNFSPAYVSPFVVLLASNELHRKYKRVSGALFEVGGGWIGSTRWQRAKGIVKLGDVTPEDIKGAWSEITNFSEPSHPTDINDANSAILQRVTDATMRSQASGETSYTYRDVILYNLGIGATRKELHYTYEHSPNFQVIPTFPILQAMNAGFIDFTSLVNNFDYSMLLHGEQYLKLHQYPVPTEASVRIETKPVSILDKGGRAALTVIGYNVIDKATNNPIAYSEGSYFVRGANVPAEKVVKGQRPKFAATNFEAPSRDPDFEAEFQTNDDQAALYRLNGDYNPLHIDPKVGKFVGFPKPILHGLCTTGITIKHLFDKFGQFDELKVRMTDFVFPGDKLQIKAWKEADGVVIFETIDLDRDATVLANAAIKLVGASSKL